MLAGMGRITELQRDIRLGALSTDALVERCLARIEVVDPMVQAGRHGAHNSARAEADLLDCEATAGHFRGPLHDIPIGIQEDTIDVAASRRWGQPRRRARYIGPWTALGSPIVTQPVGRHANGLPIGMLVCGRPGSDRALARVASSPHIPANLIATSEAI